jgi:alkylhydroperoxidase/carboxymuconolactone decarboxylase family protein YurZ
VLPPLRPALPDGLHELFDTFAGLLFGDVWKRPALSPRDRSLVTIVALTANGDAEQLGFHLRRGIENGLTKVQPGEAMAHPAFYAGWPKAFSGTAAIAKLEAPKPAR